MSFNLVGKQLRTHYHNTFIPKIQGVFLISREDTAVISENALAKQVDIFYHDDTTVTYGGKWRVVKAEDIMWYLRSGDMVCEVTLRNDQHGNWYINAGRRPVYGHINLFPEHPLRGKNIPTGPRFPDMHEAYDKGLIGIAEKVAEEKGIRLVHGVYLGTQGPTYETPAEYKAYHMLGGDAIGMSTVPEVIVARHCGIKVFGISIITNIGLSDTPTEATHEEVQEAANQAQPRMAEIFRGIIQNADI